MTVLGDDPAASSRVARRDRTRANDEAILDAAIARICATGVDALSMREVASAAGLTSGAMYARYENAAELAVAVWQRRCAGEFMQLLFDALTLLERDDPALLGAVAARLTHPSPALRAAIEILVVARRIDELAELAEVMMPAALDEVGRRGLGRDTDEMGRALRVAMAGNILGGLLQAIVPGMRQPDWHSLLAWHAIAAKAPTDRPTGDRPVLTPGRAHAETGDPLRDRIIDAVGVVVARSGFERATISRVARRAECGIAAIYDRYPNRSALVADAARVLLWSLDRTSAMRYPDLAVGEGDAAAAVLAANVSRASEGRRRLRLEIFVAAAHDPQIAAAVVDAERAALEEAATRFAASGMTDRAAVGLWVDSARIGSRGIQLAAELQHDLDEVDFRWMTRPTIAAAYAALRSTGS